MYSFLLLAHSVFRWAVVFSLTYAIIISVKGYFGKTPFTKTSNTIRHWTATIAHIQLITGILLYVKSPFVKQFFATANNTGETLFFGIIHILLMLLAIVLITIGSAKSKREKSDQAKFKIMLIWFSLAALLILLAIPWPFSPLANRPLIRF
ncbi:hypothetical protein [Flavobacterium beibuense]|uniref:hypothetical protein n=1 Tax=Flavobacterium beibuense TaxID=657326 RepID=UPI003A92D98F